MANFTLSVAAHKGRLLRESKTAILMSVGEMSFRVELDFSSCPVSGETLDELETWTPESPVDEISIIRSALSGVSTKANRSHPSIVDLMTSRGIRLPCVRVIKTFLAAAKRIEGVSISGFFSAGCWLKAEIPLVNKIRKLVNSNPDNFRISVSKP